MAAPPPAAVPFVVKMESKKEATSGLMDAAVEFIAAAYGADEAERFRRSATDAEALTAPLTWQAKVKAEAEALIRSRPLTPADRARIQPLLKAMQAKLAVPSEFDSMLMGGPIGLSFAGFLADARKAVGESVFVALVDPLTRIGGWADLIVPGMDRDFAPTGSTFEERVRAVASALHRAAEVSYKPFLEVALKLTPTRSEPAPRVSVPNTLGQLLADCRAAWKRTSGPLQVLFEGIEIVRNSEGHVQTEFDFVRGTVAFANRPQGRPVERVGPWTEAQLLDYGRSFFDLVATLALVYRASQG